MFVFPSQWLILVSTRCFITFADDSDGLVDENSESEQFDGRITPRLSRASHFGSPTSSYQVRAYTHAHVKICLLPKIVIITVIQSPFVSMTSL